MNETKDSFIHHTAEALYNSIRSSLSIEDIRKIDDYSFLYDQWTLDPEIILVAMEVLEEEGW